MASRSTGFERDASGAVGAVITDQGTVACDRVVVATGPWVQSQWAMLDLPTTTAVLGRRRPGPRHAHVGVLVPPGGDADRRPGLSDRQRRQHASGRSHRHRRPPVRRAGARGRRALGCVLQARLQLRWCPGWVHALHRRQALRAGPGRPVRPRLAGLRRRPRLPPHMDGGFGPLSEDGSRARATSSATSRRVASGASRPTAFRYSTHSPRTCTSSPTRTMATR